MRPCLYTRQSLRLQMLVLRRSGWVPLLNGQGLVLGRAEADHLALRVEGIEIDVGDDAKGRRRRKGRQQAQLPVRELRLPAAGGAIGRGRVPEDRGGRGHDGVCGLGGPRSVPSGGCKAETRADRVAAKHVVRWRNNKTPVSSLPTTRQCRAPGDPRQCG
jgi:hypothetical protein